MAGRQLYSSQAVERFSVQAIPDGAAGTRETLKHMRELVRAGKVDPDLRDFAQRLCSSLRPKDFDGEIAALFDFVRECIRYALDVNGVEVVQAPDVTLQLGYGDCDDKCVLLATLLETMGHRAWFCALGFDEEPIYTHVIVWASAAGEAQPIALDATELRPLGWFPPDATHLLFAEI